MALAFLGSGCNEQFLGPEPANTSESNFNSFWQGFDRHYSYFSVKGIDWDSVYQAYQPRIRSTTTDEELFTILSEMGALLQDGHYTLQSDDFYFYFSYRGVSPKSLIPVHPSPAVAYLENERQVSPYVTYANVRNTDLGYLRITDLDGDPKEYEVIDEVLRNLSETKAMIVDARTTGGGDPDAAEVVASRFADRPYAYRQYKYRNGETRNDFTDWITDVISPAGEFRYTRPVIMLTDRRCFSACESFVLMMHVLPQVTTLGDTTFGGTARAVWQELPNGWSYRVSTWFVIRSNGQVVEGNGIPPDVVQPYVASDSFNTTDDAMERAIRLLTDS